MLDEPASDEIRTMTVSRGASLLAVIPLTLGLAATGIEFADERFEEVDPEPVVEVVFFDVGQGDCAVLTTNEPEPTVIVIDGGFSGTADESVIPYLKARGVSKIDLMIMTHADMDHVSGLRRVLENFQVLEIWDPGYDHDTTTYARFRELAYSKAKKRYYRPLENQVVSVSAEDRNDAEERRIILGQAEDFGLLKLIPLHTSRYLHGPSDSYLVNNSSIVVRVEVGDHGNSILFTGDANGRSQGIGDGDREDQIQFTEAALLALEADFPDVLRSTVLKVPHHGSLTSSSHQFVEAVRPQWAVVSSGITQHDLPRAATLARYSAMRTNILRTDAIDDTRADRGDDHLMLVMGAKPGHLIWRQADTRSLLESIGG